MNCAAPPASTITRNRAACTTFLVVTTPSAEITIAAAMMPKNTFWAIMIGTRRNRNGGGPLLLALHVGALLERVGLGHRLHPLAELVLVVEQVGDPRLGVLELRAPEERVERAHLHADAAVH